MSPHPWKFHVALYGHAHVVADAEGRMLAVNVVGDDGPLMAAAPALLELVREIARSNGAVGAEARAKLRALGLESGPTSQ